MSSWLAASLRMGRGIVGVAACALFGALSLAAQGEQMFKGEITDSECAALRGHATTLEKGETNAHCTIACVKKMGAKYVLFDPENEIVYPLDDQKMPEAFAAQYVVIIGFLDKAGAIHVDDIVRDLPPSVKHVKSVAIVCDACPRGMAKARLAAFQQLVNWNRFAVVPNPRNADLIFLFSANSYLGDYGTRDGPDQRPVSVDITYMNVVDQHTGESLWGGSRQLGSLFVPKATRDLIAEFREQLEMDESSVGRQLFVQSHRIPKAAEGPVCQTCGK